MKSSDYNHASLKFHDEIYYLKCMQRNFLRVASILLIWLNLLILMCYNRAVQYKTQFIFSKYEPKDVMSIGRFLLNILLHSILVSPSNMSNYFHSKALLLSKVEITRSPVWSVYTFTIVHLSTPLIKTSGQFAANFPRENTEGQIKKATSCLGDGGQDFCLSLMDCWMNVLII